MFSASLEAYDELERRAHAKRYKALRPAGNMTLPEWADEYRYLSPMTSNISGRWRTSRFEVARGPMMAVTEPGVEMISAMTATQTLKSELLLNIIGFHVHQRPRPMLLVQPKEDLARAFSKERLSPMARATPVLSELMDDRVRGGTDTIQYKEFPGGFLALAYAGSATELASRPISVTLLDEIDKYETLIKEGDPVMIAEERTSTYKGNRLMVRCCSPTWEETSRIYRSYSESDQRKPFIACPHCGHWQTLDFFRHVQWEKDSNGEHFPMTAEIICESCKEPWKEADRMRAVTTEGMVRWYQTREFTCCGEHQVPLKSRNWQWNEKLQIGYALCDHCGERAVSNKHAGFQASKLFHPKMTVIEIAEMWIAVKDDPEAKQVFYNTQLALPFQLQAMRKIETHALATRKESFEVEVPEGGLVLTAGVDVQSGGSANEGRLECEVVAWGAGYESWSIDYRVFVGDPALPMLWRQLDDYLKKSFTDWLGRPRPIEATCVDSGGHVTEEVYKFCSARVRRNIWAIKGRSERGGVWGEVWPAPAKYDPKRTRVGYRPIIIGVNAAKETVRQFLLVEEPGPGYSHFPKDRPEMYFEQLTSEKLVLEKKAGRNVKKWILQKGHANEALDARVYAYAALRGLHVVRKFSFERRADLLEALGRQNQAHKPSNPGQAPVPPAKSRVRRSSFMG